MHGLTALPRRRQLPPSSSLSYRERLGSLLPARLAARPERVFAAAAFALSLFVFFSICLPHPSVHHGAYGPMGTRDLVFSRSMGLDRGGSSGNTGGGSSSASSKDSSSSSDALGSDAEDDTDTGYFGISAKRQAAPLTQAAPPAQAPPRAARMPNNATVDALVAGQTSVVFPEVVLVDPTTYLRDTPSEFPEMDEVRHRLQQHIANSTVFPERVAAVRRRNKRGIIINAGGSLFLTNLIIVLKVLREEHNCTMEVEVFWQGSLEMDNTTLRSLQDNFGPLRGYDITTLPHPVPGLHKGDVDLSRFTGKVYSLLHTHFSEVIMMDADSLPAQPPEVFFQHPQYKATGCLFWPDAWTATVADQAFLDAGVDPVVAKEALAVGRGWSRRDTESGQLLIDLRQHLDVVEYVFWLNSFGPSLKLYMWGDKDSFPISFAAAGKAHMFSQVAIPPAGLFKWRPNVLLTKETSEVSAGWQLLGFLQHDSWGRPAFVHRTINKFKYDEPPWELEVISPPLSRRWIDYYLAHDSLGPTRGVPWDYVVPASAFTMLAMSQPVTRVFADRKGWVKVKSKGCPHVTFLEYWTMREAALCVDVDVALEELCMPFLKGLMGDASYKAYKKKGYLQHPGLHYLSAKYMEDVIFSADGYFKDPEGSPLPAWHPTYGNKDAPSLPGSFSSLVRASYEAQKWTLVNQALFPMVVPRKVESPPPGDGTKSG